MRKRILLLNPPGTKTYIRDYYCSKVSKSNYLFHPVDLLMLSGILAERHEVFLIDAIADRIGEAECVAMIDALSPDTIISLIGAVSLNEDIEFLKKVKNSQREILVSGDAALDDTQLWLKDYPFIDAVVTDFTSSDIIPYLEGDHQRAATIISADTGNPPPIRERHALFDIPIPRHDLFTSRGYSFPFVRRKEFATVLTDYGCPYKCSFCVMSTLGYKCRSVGSVLEELSFLHRLGKKEIFFIDQTFGADRDRTLDICSRMAQEDFGFGWVCYSRVDIVTGDMLAAMKKAGCHTIIFGVESASEEILRKYRKGYTKAQIREAFRLCREYGIRTVATFILGLPEESEETVTETISFLKEIDCAFASFNVAVPRMGTPLRQEAIRQGLISSDLVTMDQTGTSIAMPTRSLTREQLRDLRSRAIREFYLRPSYLVKRLMGISTFYELKEQFYEGWSLLKDLFRGNDDSP